MGTNTTPTQENIVKEGEKFHRGMQILATRGAKEAFDRTGHNVSNYLYKHFHGDYGYLPEDDIERNDEAIIDGSRILSHFLLKDGTRIWIITDGVIDNKGTRQATTVLLPEEY